jgi:hypothetical protein
MQWLSVAWTILKSLLGIGGNTSALTQVSEDKGKLEVENADQKNALAASSDRNDIDNSVHNLSDTALTGELRRYTSDFK